MEVTHSVDPRFLHSDGAPFRVTDYKLYSADFRAIRKPVLNFDTSSEYVMTGFHIGNEPFLDIIHDLQQNIRKNHGSEYGHIVALDKGKYFQTNKVLTGESGIGYEVMNRMHMSDYFHTHSIRSGEGEDAVNLFSSDDLYALSAKAIDRMWLVTPKNVWSMVNLYGNRYYYQVQEENKKMQVAYNPIESYEAKLAKLIASVQKCEFRLYNSTNTIDYTLVS